MSMPGITYVKAHPEVEPPAMAGPSATSPARGRRAWASLEARDEALLRLRGLPGAGDQSPHSGDRARTGTTL